MAGGNGGTPTAGNPFGFGGEAAPPPSSRSEPVADWHAGLISTVDLADQLSAEVLGDIEFFTRTQRRNSQVKYGPAWSVAFWWHEVRDELDLTGFSSEDYEALLGRLAPALPDWALRLPPPPATAGGVDAGRECSARIYLDVDGAFSPICMNLQDERDLAWMRGPAVAIGEAPQTGWTWKMTGGFGPTPLPIELAHQLVALNDRTVEVVWVTSWHEMANRLLDDCGVATRLRCHPTVDEDTVNDKWQFVVTELQCDPAPFVWIDDQQITPSTWRWAATCGVANLLVHTNRYHGVTPTTWSRVTSMAPGHSRHRPAEPRRRRFRAMSDWFHGITTGEWAPQTTPQSESPAAGDGMSTVAFQPPHPSDDPPQRNVWTLRNGERLDTPERFFDWLECWYRDDAVARESGDLDRLIARRRGAETRANQRLQRSIN